MDNQLVTLKNVSYTINKNFILKNISLEITRNKPTAIMGMNGAGKTTLLKILAGIYKPTRGNVLFNPPYLKNTKISYLFQHHIFLDRTVFNNLLHSLTFTNDDNKNHISMINDYLSKFNLIKYSNSHINELSSGERQLVSIIRTLLIDSDIFFLDEPFNNLDQNYRELVNNLFIELAKIKKIIFITHSINEAKLLTDEILILKDGVLQ
tara:strand:+ start:592 stop:1215 length:624 start_codon:yes stop_codon:yes gene_type:complete